MGRNVKYRGICGAVRRAIAAGELSGMITAAKVRDILPEGKKDAPLDTILASLKRLESLNEIVEKDKAFMTKDHAENTDVQRVWVEGVLLNTTMKSGKVVVTIEVESFDSK